MNEKRDEILNILNLNVAQCLLKKNMHNDAIKHCKEALTYVKHNPKAYYRMSIAYQALNDLDRAKENLEMAIKQEPNDRAMRVAFKALCDEKGKKEREWYSKMSGFYNSDKLDKVSQKDEEQTILREKIKRQMMDNQNWN